MLGALRTLNETPSKLSVGEGDNARPVSLLQTMAFGINSASANNPDLEDHRIIANAIIPASGSLEEAVNAVLPFIHTTYVDRNDISPTSFMSPAVIKASRDAGLINPSRLTEQKRMADKATAEQTGELILTAQRIVRGYVDEDGQIQSSTAVGNLELRLLGVEYLEEGASVVKEIYNGGESDSSEDFKSNIDSYIDHLATLPGMDRIKYNEDGRRQVEEIVDEIRDEYNRATTEAQRSMAVRQQHRNSLVYQLSSILGRNRR